VSFQFRGYQLSWSQTFKNVKRIQFGSSSFLRGGARVRGAPVLQSLRPICCAAGALLLAPGSDAADRQARFAVVGRDASSSVAAADADAELDVTESGEAEAMHDVASASD